MSKKGVLFMQTPTLPTKPTPPTPPTMNSKPSSSSNTEPSTSPPTSTSKSQTTETPKEFKTTSAPPATLERSVSVDKNTSPPQPSLGAYQETSSQTTPAPIAPASKKQQSPLGSGFLFSLVLLIGIAIVCFRLWKNNQNVHKEPRTILDYSTDTSKDLLDLMNSPTGITPSSQIIVQGKNKASSKIKGNFEVRV
jgi:hypothetical protein